MQTSISSGSHSRSRMSCHARIVAAPYGAPNVVRSLEIRGNDLTKYLTHDSARNGCIVVDLAAPEKYHPSAKCLCFFTIVSHVD
jgi:hypothetical protein